MKADGHSTYLKITDTDTGAIIAGAKWCIYEEEPERPERLVADWYGKEGSADRVFGQAVLDEFHGWRVGRMKGAHCCTDALAYLDNANLFETMGLKLVRCLICVSVHLSTSIVGRARNWSSGGPGRRMR